MTFKKLSEGGPVIISPVLHKDERGYFYESFNEKEFKENIGEVNFVQDNQSKSSYGVLRGMHFQKGDYAQAKLVRVVKGAVVDVALDIRPNSPTYGSYFSVYLSDRNHNQFFIPRGFAHGFLTLEDDTVFQYKCDNFYNKESEGSFRWDSFFMPWDTIIPLSDIILSDKDKIAPEFLIKKVTGYE